MNGLDEARRLIAEEQKQQTGTLDIGNLGLTELPEEVYDLVHLETLNLGSLYFDSSLTSRSCSHDLAGNEISTLGSRISELTSLRNLSIGEDFDLPLEDIRHLTALRSLVCRDSELSDVTHFDYLTSLEVLHLSRTKVMDLSPLSNLTSLLEVNIRSSHPIDLNFVKHLTQLRKLDIGWTKISDLAPLEELTHLQQLYCNATKISDLGPLAGLIELRDLSISWTSVTDLTPLQGLVNLRKFRCRSNKVSDLRPLSQLEQLVDLDLGLSAVADLGPLAKSPNLRKLNVSGTSISDLAPLELFTNLQELRCESARVSDLGPLAGLTNLMKLWISHTPVVDLAPLVGLSNLQVFHFDSSQISDLSPLSALKGLVDLNGSFTQVTDLSPLAELTNLQRLNVAETQVSDLSPLAWLTSLEELRLGSTQVSDLSPLSDLTSLVFINIGGTRVSDLGPLGKLTKLRELSFSDTKVSDLMPLAGMVSLQTLTCSSTPILDLSPIAGLTELNTLSCISTQVSDLSPLSTISSLIYIDVDSTQVDSLDSLAELSNLRTLDFRSTDVSDLSPLKELSSLKSLFCSSTQVSDLTGLQSISTLRDIDCSNTRVSDLTPLQGNTNLEVLNCSDTQVSDLSPLQHLASFQELSCSRTQVTDLTPLACLREISEFDCFGCRIEEFPNELLFAESLAGLYLGLGSLSGVPTEVLSQSDSDDCLKRLRGHVRDMQSGSETIRDVKVIVLGNGRIGKTQLCRKLLGEDYDDGVPSTHGITIKAVNWNDSDASPVLNVWDFGGQDIYHGAHALFMASRAVFIVVWHPEFEGNKETKFEGMLFRNYGLPYWLDYVRNLGGERSPVVVVQSQCDRLDQELRELPVEEGDLEFPFTRTCWYSAKKGRGEATLRESIEHSIEFLRGREGITAIGKGRMQVLRQLQDWREEDEARDPGEREHRTLSKLEFENLCKEYGGVSSPSSLLEYLHNAGAVFYRKELFDERVILDQTWALDAIYSVFDRKKSYRQLLQLSGRFTRSLLELTVWQDYSEAEQKLFLSMMESCGVCFVHKREERWSGAETEYIAPDLLPSREQVFPKLAGRWSVESPTASVEYSFAFLHQGLIRSIISDLGHRAGDAAEYWKDGLWFYSSGPKGRAVVEQEMHDYRRGVIRVQVQDAGDGALLRWIRTRVEEVISQFGARKFEITQDGEVVPKVATETGKRVRQSFGDEDESEAYPGANEPSKQDKLAEPNFSEPPEGPSGPQVFVSFAWGDGSPEGREREKLVDDLCNIMEKEHGLEIIRDRSHIEIGDRISKFMNQLARGDFIIAVISDKYLKSPFCMYELFHIYRNCAEKPNRFLKKVIPLFLPDVVLEPDTERLKYAMHWKEEKDGMKAALEKLGADYFSGEDLAKYKNMKDFAENVSAILGLLSDKLFPRDFERQRKEGFTEILKLIGHQ